MDIAMSVENPKEPKSPSKSLLKYDDIPESSSIRRIKYLSLQGGGMKGLGYVGAIEQLEACGVMDQIEEVAGSSAGSIVATLIAVGYTAQEIRQEMLALNFRALQDKDEPGWLESYGMGGVIKTGTAIFQEAMGYEKKFDLLTAIEGAVKLPSKITEGVERAEDILKLAFSRELGLWKGDALSNHVSRMIERKTGDPKITFAKLKSLAKANPGKFRALHLTGSNLSTRKLEHYNASDWPDLPIVDAVRISASFPGGFKPVTVPLTQEEKENLKNGKVPVRVDGGLLQNLPDVFNEYPFYHATKDAPGNPEAMALTLKDPENEKPMEIKKGIDLAKALYSSVMSERELYQKYGQRMAVIDTKGVKTLDFDADDERRLALADSGIDAVQSMLKAMLAQDEKSVPIFEQMDLEELSHHLDELIRQKVTKQYRLNQLRDRLKSGEVSDAERDAFKEEKKKLLKSLREIDQIIEDGKEQGTFDHNELARLEQLEKQRLEQRLKGAAKIVYSDEELLQICQERYDEYTRTTEELQRQLKQLQIMQMSLDWRMDELRQRARKKSFRIPVLHDLETLHNAQEEIKKNKDKQIKLTSAMHAPDSKLTDEKYKKKMKILHDEARNLKHNRDIHFQGILKHVQEMNDPLLFNFFKELRDNCRDINFEIPRDLEEIKAYHNRDLALIAGFMKECRKKIAESIEKAKSFDEQMQAIEMKGKTSTNYQTMKELKTELDRSIYENTSTVVKIQNWLGRKIESKWVMDNIIYPILLFTEFLAFSVRVALSVSTFFLAIVLLVRNNTKNTKTRAQMDWFLNKLEFTNLKKIQKMRGLSKMVAELLFVLEKNYAKSDLMEHSHLYRIFGTQLKGTGCDVSDLFPMKDTETDEQYWARLDKLENKLKLLLPETQVLRDDDSPRSKKLQLLRKNVFKDLALMPLPRVSDWNNQGFKREPMLEEERVKRQSAQINQEYLRKVDEKIKNGEELSETEIIEYIESAKNLKKDIPATIQKPFLKYVQDKIEQGKHLSKHEVEYYRDFAEALGRPISSLMSARYKEWLWPESLVYKYKVEKDKEFIKTLDAFLKAKAEAMKAHTDKVTHGHKPKKKS